MKIATKIPSFAGAAAASLLALSISFGGALAANAQVADATMPPLYDAQGMEVNISNTSPLAAGLYYLAPGAQANTQVYYYGNGTFVNQTTGLYGGSISDPDGTVGVPLVYGTRVGTGTTAPGAPNTGAGGDAPATLMTLAIAGVIAVAGASFLATRKNSTSAAI